MGATPTKQKKNRLNQLLKILRKFFIIFLLYCTAFFLGSITRQFFKNADLKMDNKFLEKIIIECSSEFNLDPRYMCAHFESENRKFDRKAIGKDGEIGIGQMLPKTASREALNRGYTNLSESIDRDKKILFDPYINVFLSCAHYRTILNMENIDDMIDCMAEYNKGKAHWRMKNNYPILLKQNYERRFGHSDINDLFKKIK